MGAGYLETARPQQDLILDDNHVYLGTDGCGVQVKDLYSGEIRTSSIKDVRDIARVADFLPEIAFHWVPVSAQDRPPETRGLHEIKTIWENSTKASIPWRKPKQP
jgi:trimethylamine--corrinoid protein Co-methyltransferase